MGKIRVNTIGDESAEQAQKLKQEKRKEAKKAASKDIEKEVKEDKAASANSSDEPRKKVVVKKQTSNKKMRSSRYSAISKTLDKTKTYSILDAITMLLSLKPAGFDEAVELHINTIEKVTGNITLPHGTGKKTRIAVISISKDATGAEKLIKEIESGKIDFDILVATPDSMPKLAKLAKILGPKGLMPNPKSGTVTTKPEEVAKKFSGGLINYKTEAKANIIHIAVGKVSFGKEKIKDNIEAMLKAIGSSKTKNIFLKSTMSPSLRIGK